MSGFLPADRFVATHNLSLMLFLFLSCHALQGHVQAAQRAEIFERVKKSEARKPRDEPQAPPEVCAIHNAIM